jgi:hypothetical protein
MSAGPSGIICGKNFDRATLKKAYDGCKVKDMRFEEFVTEMEKMADPIQMAKDMAGLRSKIRSGVFKK